MRASILAFLALAGFTFVRASSVATFKSAAASAASSAASSASTALSSRSVSGSAAAASSSPASVGSLSPCALGCINAAATNSSCGSFGNITCLCTDAKFQLKAVLPGRRDGRGAWVAGVANRRRSGSSLRFHSLAAPAIPPTPFNPLPFPSILPRRRARIPTLLPRAPPSFITSHYTPPPPPPW
ncbi:hypothetical protein DFH09DRAFT_1354596 [Mycena vulgaris]|nr:hypothetical protein DFH09DRAFT_1354596 [Mycena vulgaris]